MIVNLASANRDDAHYERPAALDVERPTSATSASATASTSASAHRWPGWKVASRSAASIDRFPDLRLAVPAENSAGTTATASSSAA